MSKPAARVGDYHGCPAYNGKVPHVGGPIITGSPNVLIGGQPAARVGDQAVCTGGGVDTIVLGSSTVFVNGQPLALAGSPTAHGGVVISGAPNVIVGDMAAVPAGRSTTTPSTQAPDLSSSAALKRVSAKSTGSQPQTVITSKAHATSASAEAPVSTEPAHHPINPHNRLIVDSARAPSEPGAGVAMASNDAKPITPAVAQTLKVVTGMFFDGTGNNASNTQTRRRLEDQCLTAYEAGALSKQQCEKELAHLQELGASPFNDLSNVAKLYDLYRDKPDETITERIEYLRVYVDGIGTKTGEEDSGISMGTGLGSLGVIAKVKDGSEKLAKELREQRTLKIEHLTLDIFGFSRGAAAARHFASEVLKGPDGILGQALAAQGIPWPQQVEIRFVGLFDTVAAIVNLLGGDFSPHNAQNDPVNINLSPERIRHVVQLAARDEHRHNFSLNSLRSPDGSLPANFREWVLPGAHSDIGGGYLPLDTENLLIAPPEILPGIGSFRLETTPIYQKMEMLRQEKLGEGWVGPYSLSPGHYYIETKRINQFPFGGMTQLELRLERKVQGEYSRAPLHLMHELARRQGVPFNDIDSTDPDWTIPHELGPIAHHLFEHVLEDTPLQLTTEMEALLKQRYVHHSHHYGVVGHIFRPHKPTRGRRAIHPNHPAG